MMPIGIIASVITGSTRNCASLQCHSVKAAEPDCPIPLAGSTMYSTAKMITSTSPSQ
jgi:hypothetical protein